MSTLWLFFLAHGKSSVAPASTVPGLRGSAADCQPHGNSLHAFAGKLSLAFTKFLQLYTACCGAAGPNSVYSFQELSSRVVVRH